MRTLLGLVIAACVITLLWFLAVAVFRWVRPHGLAPAVLCTVGAVFVAYALLAAVVNP